MLAFSRNWWDRLMAKTEARPVQRPASNGVARGAETNGKSQRRRQELIDAAAKIFQDKGYEAASIQDVADALGILKGSVYYYIDSKEDLLFAAIQEVHESALANMEKIQQHRRGPAHPHPAVHREPRQARRRQPGEGDGVLPRLPFARPRTARLHRAASATATTPSCAS